MYSPEIAKDLIPILYRLGKEKKKPMTKIVDEILRSKLQPKGTEEIKEKSKT
ncbi:hypothetical protein [Candidatus Manganitrophus noduliformans]|uniref:hypothetical protein n=1 Tax=Candidatus Manganitrophus noduliformans TaxID=2606439 RepID=UPI00143B421D|nr:hypothetical protein [Candidatus Manganitrophus noduliformans]